MDWLKIIHGETPTVAPANFNTGDDIRVWYKILEHGKVRLGQFEGTVIRYRGSGSARTFTVRRVTHGEGVERVFPIDSKTVSKIEVLRRGKVRRSRLYYLRTVIGKTRIAAADTVRTPKTDGAHPAPPPLSPSAVTERGANDRSGSEKSESPASSGQPAAQAESSKRA